MKTNHLAPLTILNQPISVGKTILHFDFAKLHTRTSIEVPIIIERSKKPGPTLLLLAGIHGDEVNGVEIVRQIIAKKYNKPEAGTIICIPVMNVFGFLNLERQFPDGRDLNRVFPGSSKGSLASRFAHKIMTEIVPHIDYCIDFHTGGGDRFNYAQVRIDDTLPENMELAKVFNAKFIINSKVRDNSFRKSLTVLGKKVLLFEGGKSLSLKREVTKTGVQGALRVMDHLGIRNFKNEIIEHLNPEAPIVIRKSTWLRANHAGMYRNVVSLGEKVTKGDVIGSISDPYGEFEKNVKASHSGYVICSNQAPLVNQGDALVHISVES
mgnify:CR=1 FL=1